MTKRSMLLFLIFGVLVQCSPTPYPTPSPTSEPSPYPTPRPTPSPTSAPSPRPTPSPTLAPTGQPTPYPSPLPTPSPSKAPTPLPSPSPSAYPTPNPTFAPSAASAASAGSAGAVPTPLPTEAPAVASVPTVEPTQSPTSNITAAAVGSGGFFGDSFEFGITQFVLASILAMLLKISTSVDDLLWFSPFLTLCASKAEKIRVCCIYFLVCGIITAGAIILASLAKMGMNFLVTSEDTFWDSERILAVISGTSIFLYAMYELQDWLKEHNMPSCFSFCAHVRSVLNGSQKPYQRVDSNDEHTSASSTDPAPASTAIQLAKDDPENRVATEDLEQGPTPDGRVEADNLDDDSDDSESVETKIADARSSTYRLFVVAFCGTLDDLTMFAVVIMGHSITYLEVAVGAAAAALVVVFLCWQMANFKPFADCIQAIPMWALLCVLSVYILIGGLLEF